ncbi:hypothetical protein GCM10012320_20370 [Sinomonas cellulolyticus]|uniref:DUF3592 domain-containing protein n=1 Tax=Sinomonas cellulolyticus TaxID=2801916 RepID=A0ABS1K1W1_9MICC|nr:MULTISPECIES: hypothetical protein [Sinomonas]MBL0705549.1 hypothetical protein [Sinomonas cellulolyticus]GHG51287.1 hypothetical protein GCM10012320_20370 [Sinomonas sp. KCTC 49339]
MGGDPELLTLTPDLELVSDGRPAGDGPAWVESGLRHRHLVRLRVAIVLAFLAVLAWGGGFWFLTRPFHEDWPATAATVVRTHEFYAKGTHCEVYLQLASSPQPRTVMFSGFAPCRELPAVRSAVTVTVDPTDADSVRIIGYDRPLWGDIGFALVLLAQPVLWASVYLLFALVRFRRGRKAGGAQPWRSLTVRFVARTIYKGGVSARLWVLDAENKERTFLLSGRASALPGLTGGRPGMQMTLWLVGDGHGNVLVREPDSRPVLGRAYAPNGFELRTGAMIPPQPKA